MRLGFPIGFGVFVFLVGFFLVAIAFWVSFDFPQFPLLWVFSVDLLSPTKFLRAQKSFLGRCCNLPLRFGTVLMSA